MKWHKDLTCIGNLTKWINNNNIYGATTANPFVYNSILDFPDEDDPEYKNYGGSLQCPCWKNISTVKAVDNNGTTITSTQSQAQALYELVVDNYYFYKIKGQGLNNDNNENEHETSIDEKDFFEWGVMQFDRIILDECNSIKLGMTHDKDGAHDHMIHLKTLTKG